MKNQPEISASVNKLQYLIFSEACLNLQYQNPYHPHTHEDTVHDNLEREITI